MAATGAVRAAAAKAAVVAARPVQLVQDAGARSSGSPPSSTGSSSTTASLAATSIAAALRSDADARFAQRMTGPSLLACNMLADNPSSLNAPFFLPAGSHSALAIRRQHGHTKM